jgi:PAS domain S-box-containing protein
MYGYTPQEVGQLTIEDISSGQSPYTQRDALRWIKKAAEGRPQVFEWRAKDKGGRLFWVEVNLKLAAVGGKDRVLVVVRDISERKQAEEIRDRLNKELKAKNKELESILYVASHDLRSPLVNIEGFSQELSISCQKLRSALKGRPVKTETDQQACKVLEENIPEALNFILASSRKMDTLMSGLLRLSRLGREATTIKKLDMNAMMDNIIASMEYQIKESSAAVAPESLPPCQGDASQINQVFSNILDNALKYLDRSRRGKIRITGTVQADQSIYCIEDNGVGISADQQEKIFEIFYRLGPDDKTGEGLGLSIVRRILDRHNGRVWVESVKGQGSRFYVSLPRA